VSARQGAVLRRRAEDEEIAAAAAETGRAAEAEKAAKLVAKRANQRSYGEELRGAMAGRELSMSPIARKAAARATGATFAVIGSATGAAASAILGETDTPGFMLKTQSSDADLEGAFKREMVKQMGLVNRKINNSEAVAPLLGFGATFASALEEAGRSAADARAAEVAAAVTADPLTAIKPGRVTPGSTVRGISIGKRK
jgi:hypothetical protein